LSKFGILVDTTDPERVGEYAEDIVADFENRLEEA
jgi:hypothetical protein